MMNLLIAYRYWRYLFVMMAMIWVMGCSDLYDTPEDVYLIKKGEHRSQVGGSVLGNNLRSLKSRTLKFTVRFDASAAYELNAKDQGDINKLFGFSDCNSFHHKNSVRIGWAYDKVSKKISLSAYVYQNGQRVIRKIQEVEIGATYLCKIELSGDHYEITIANNETARIPRGNTCDRGLYYLLYPYFGGNQPAPHDIRIYIKELYD